MRTKRACSFGLFGHWKNQSMKIFVFWLKCLLSVPLNWIKATVCNFFTSKQQLENNFDVAALRTCFLQHTGFEDIKHCYDVKSFLCSQHLVFVTPVLHFETAGDAKSLNFWFLYSVALMFDLNTGKIFVTFFHRLVSSSRVIQSE